MTRVLSFLICLTIFSPLFSKWKKVIEGVNFTEYFEIDTVKKQEEIIYIWSMKDFKKLREDGNLSTKFYSVYDCNAMKYKIISIINYKTNMGKGRDFKYEKNIMNDPTDLKWKSVKPESNDMLRLRFVCGYKRNKK